TLAHDAANEFALHYIRELTGVGARSAEPVEALEQALLDDPGNAEIHRRLAAAIPIASAKELEIVRQHAHLAGQPNDAGAYNNLAILYQAREQIVVADRLFARSLAIAADDLRTLNNYGINCLKLGAFTRALEAFEQACARAPDDAGSQAN